MKRFRRRLFDGLAFLSLLLLVVTVVMWWRSYREPEVLTGSIGYISSNIYDGPGFLISTTMFQRHAVSPFFRFVDEGGWFPVPASVGPGWYHVTPSSVTVPPWTYGRFGISAPKWPTMYSIQLAMPHWFLTMMLAIYPITWLWSHRKLRTIPGHCRKCGYDLRATPDRCPECGQIAENII